MLVVVRISNKDALASSRLESIDESRLTLRVELLGDLHRLLGVDAQFARCQLFQLLSRQPARVTLGSSP